MAAGVFQFMSFNTAGIFNVIVWGFVFLCLSAIITAFFVTLAVAKTNTKFLEIDLVNKRIRNFTGRWKKQRTNKRLKHLWVGKLKKNIPHIQQNDIYTKKTNDFVILIKDRNGYHHTARLPSWNEIKKWYQVVYDIDITERDKDGQLKYTKQVESLKTIYLMPNPSEDLDWLGDQVVEAKENFADVWWKHPNAILIGSLALCGFIFIMTLIISKKM